MTSDGKWLLVIGYGSIGRRHFQNALSLGWRDVRLLRTTVGRPGAFQSPPDTQVYTDLDAAIADSPYAAIVANPSALHAETTKRLLKAHVPVLLEKPVCVTEEEAAELLKVASAEPTPCSIAYAFRHHPLYSALHDIANSGRLGRIFHADTWWAAYLPSWHPWEDFRSGYAARVDLGGGVVRTLDHELDMLRWNLGQPRSVIASTGSLAGLGVEVEDTADMIFGFEDGAQAHCHVTFGRRDLSRGASLVGEHASATLDWSAGTLTVADGSGVQELIGLPDGFDLNEIYLRTLAEALDGFDGKAPRTAVPLEDGVAALEMALGALRSSRLGVRVTLKGMNHGQN